MKVGKRIMYATMNSWNNQDSLAYNLKVYNVIRKDLRNKAYEIMSDDNLSAEIYDTISCMIDDFQRACDYEYTAGFNGRSGGYLVLYKSCKIRNYETGDTRIETYMRGLDEQSVSGNVKKMFRKLAQDIVDFVEHFLQEYEIVEQEIMIPHKIKTFKATKGE